MFDALADANRPALAEGSPMATDPERAHRVTNQDLDRRVGRVETIQEQQGIRLHELGNQVNVIGLKVEHSQEMIRVRFAGLESTVGAMGVKLDTLLDLGHALQNEASSSPAGRQLLNEIEDLRAWQTRNEPTIEAARGVVTAWKLVAGGSLLTTIAAVLALLVATGVVPT